MVCVLISTPGYADSYLKYAGIQILLDKILIGELLSESGLNGTTASDINETVTLLIPII
jgi:hypothetical protein